MFASINSCFSAIGAESQPEFQRTVDTYCIVIPLVVGSNVPTILLHTSSCKPEASCPSSVTIVVGSGCGIGVVSRSGVNIPQAEYLT